jgi:phosphate/sulfate permease
MQGHKPHILPKGVIYLFFIIGLFSAISFRAIIVIQHINPSWVRVVWYAGVIGYIFFFLYRYYISKKRKRAIENYQLIEKVKANACLSNEDREVIGYLLSSVKKSLEDINYLLIFILSILAILLDIILS